MPHGVAGPTSRREEQACSSAKTQSEINQCMARADEAANEDLKGVYASLEKKLDASLFAKLQMAQHAWITYRDANGEAEAALYQGGSIERAIRSSCMERGTRGRIAELHTIYDTGTR